VRQPGSLLDVLFIAYHFPPIGGAGVQRSVKFARYLPHEGFRPIVVTGSGTARSRWEPEDATLAAELPADLPVYRVAQPEHLPASTRLDRLLGRPTAFARWWQEALRDQGHAAAARHTPRLVYVSLSPYEGLAAAALLAEDLGLPLVADLRDPWALDEVRVYPSRWHRRREAAQMQQLFARCARVLMNTPEAAAAARALCPELGEGRIQCLTNGYDAADFAGLTPRRPDGRFVIVHSGYLHTAMGLEHRRRGLLRRLLGGELWRVDFLARSHVFLIEALERLEREVPGRTRKVELVLAGLLDEADLQVVRKSPLADRIRTPGYLDHATTVRAMVEADLLFLPMHDLPDGQRARIVPGKTYEYLASGRPILAAVPPGDARDFVLAAGAGAVVAPADVAAIAAAIDRRIGQSLSPRQPGPSVARFERRRLTAELARHFREVLAALSQPRAAEVSRNLEPVAAR
jgi:glycosyltransferase involved in cell wall biosynthesis